MFDKAIKRGIENEECFGASGKSKGPLNLLRERVGLQPITPEDVDRKRRARIRLARMKNKAGWIGITLR